MRRKKNFSRIVLGLAAFYYLWKNDFNWIRTAKVMAVKALPFPLSLGPIRNRC